jgi:hypothetical protein
MHAQFRRAAFKGNTRTQPALTASYQDPAGSAPDQSSRSHPNTLNAEIISPITLGSCQAFPYHSRMLPGRSPVTFG